MGRQRSESLSCQLLKKTKLKKVQVNGCQLNSVYDLREDDEESSHFYDDDGAFRRPRSNSSAEDHASLPCGGWVAKLDAIGNGTNPKILMFPKRGYRNATVKLDSLSDPYRQYMRVVDCYELSPPSVNIIVLDKSLKVDKAFSALCEQNVRAGLVWDSSQERICSIVTLTDFLAYLQNDVAKWSSVEIGALISGNPLIAVSADTKVIAACEEFCFNGVYRIIVNEPHSGDILYLLTIRRVLQAIHKQVSMDDTLNDVVETLLTHKLSSLPVLDLNGQAADVITKIDFAVALMESDDPQRFLRETTVSTVLGHRPATVFVRPCDPVGKVLDVLLEAKHMRCVFVVDERLKPIACVSQCDVISHLIYSDAPFQKS
ncbi:unnamed protein product [Angiostrongylus costaricensis]|uniref:CBS domain-containing protein n=1 Tax=Angiostrongylus costaricensis TaxID=334426 RepID=A0A158PGG7_ANGCS|nr:unnamed protein product [Angiostrongylus costaricensis]